ncbi:MAG: DNA polymerase III subunit delta', partial [Pseudomonadota bacterium]
HSFQPASSHGAFARLTTLGSRRAIIISPADDMEASASNALLKSLEEPPQGTFFMLVTHRPSRLLPTIRSRCRVLRFPVLNREQLSTMLAASDTAHDPSARDAAIEAAGGSFGAALGFIEQDLGSVASLVRAILTEGDTGLSARSELSRVIGARADRARLQAVLDLAQAMVADAAKTTQSAYQRGKLIDAHQELVKLAAQAPSYNFDTGLLTLEIGTLLVNASAASEPAHG